MGNSGDLCAYNLLVKLQVSFSVVFGYTYVGMEKHQREMFTRAARAQEHAFSDSQLASSIEVVIHNQAAARDNVSFVCADVEQVTESSCEWQSKFVLEKPVYHAAKDQRVPVPVH